MRELGGRCGRVKMLGVLGALAVIGVGGAFRAVGLGLVCMDRGVVRGCVGGRGVEWGRVVMGVGEVMGYGVGGDRKSEEGGRGG